MSENPPISKQKNHRRIRRWAWYGPVELFLASVAEWEGDVVRLVMAV